MVNSYIKLNAKKRLVKNHFKCFVYAILPYVAIVLLMVLNYYFYIFLKGISLQEWSLTSYYEIYIKATLITVSLILSFLLYQVLQFVSHKYFYCKQNIKANKKITFRKCCTFVTVSMLKFFLSVAWGAFYLFPSAIMVATLCYSITTGGNTFKFNLTLFLSSVILAALGLGFLYTTLRRYTMCNYVIFTSEKTEAFAVIQNSIELMEGNIIKYTAYCVSFVGWLLSCVLIIPVFYVLPYIKMAKYSYFKAMTKSNVQEQVPQKPIIFYIKKKA